MTRPRGRTGRALRLALVAALAPAGASAQFVRGPEREWRTLETGRFVLHYPVGASVWAESLAPRLDAIRDSVESVVGWRLERRITLLVDDPLGADAAFASSNVRAPVISFWPRPSEPRTGDYSDYGQMRAVHEIAHNVQLARPTGRAWLRPLWRLLPAEVGPLVIALPAWVREGYAEHVENVVTGSGGRTMAWRARILRTLAHGDSLPAYDDLGDDATGRYQVGGAFFDWLAEREGEATLAALWDRIATPGGGFERAVEALYGQHPEALYAEFRRELGEQAREARARLEAAGLVEGAAVPGVEGDVDGPAVSRDGSRVASVLREGLPHVVVWSSEAFGEPLEELGYPNGQFQFAPRFLPDGRILVISAAQRAEGVFSADLYAWDPAADRLERITDGAAVNAADPMPDGRSAIATRCVYGICDLVRIDLATGAVAVVAEGSPARAFFRPRVAPEGRAAAVAVQEGRSSRIALVDLATGDWRYVDPDDGARRYEPAFFPDGRRLVLVSEADGIANLEILDLETGRARALTRVWTGAFAPEPDPRDGSVLYLRAHAGGAALHRVHPDSAPAGPRAALDPALAPIVPASPPAPSSFPRAAIAAPRDYGWGPRRYGLLPGLSVTEEGAAGHLVAASSDPIGRLAILVRAAHGAPGTWRGVGLEADVRRFHPNLSIGLFDARHAPSRQPDVAEALGPALVEALDLDLRGGAIFVRADRERNTFELHGRGAVSLARVEASTRERTTSEIRKIVLAEGTRMAVGLDGRVESWRVGDPWYLMLAPSLRLEAGRTFDRGWARAVATADVRLGRTSFGERVTLRASYGRVTNRAPEVERFSLGGGAPTLFDPMVLSQRIEMPYVVVGHDGGRRAATALLRVRLGPLTPFVWYGSAGGPLDRWRRVAGVERVVVDTEARRTWNVPGVRIVAGLGYAFEAERGKKMSAQLALLYRP